MILDKKVFHIEITVTDQMNVKRRIHFNPGANYSYAKDNIVKQQLHARVPCDLIRDNVWMNLQIDVYSFIEGCFGAINFRSIDAIQISGACRLRKILTMKSMLTDSTSIWLEKEYGTEIAQEFEEQCGSIDYSSEELPNNLNFSTGVDYINQVITYDRVRYWGYIQDLMQSGGNETDKKNRKNMNIAFGRRIVTKPVVQGKQQIQSALGQINAVKRGYSPQRALEGATKEGIIYHQLRKEGSAGRYNNQNSITNDITSQGYEINQYASSDKYQSPDQRSSKLPKSIYDGEDGGSGIDFTQYQLSTTKVTKNTQSKYSRSPQKKVNENGDVYLNEKLRYLESQRQIIHQLAEKYNLVNNLKVEKLSLITVMHPAKNGHYHGSSQDGTILNSVDPKERVKEYHEQVNQKRKEIHQKQVKKKKLLQKEQQTLNNILDGSKTEASPSPKKKMKIEQEQVNEDAKSISQHEASKSKIVKPQNQEEGNVEGWDGAEDQEDYGNEDNQEQQVENNQDNKAEEKDEYGKEEDYGKEDEEGAQDYGQEEDGGGNNAPEVEEEGAAEEEEAEAEAEGGNEEYGEEEY